MWKLLWLPPALPYYESDDIFDAPDARSFTKRLVFSAWHLVPKVISALLSYEAERLIFAASEELDARPYDEFSARPDRRIDFTVNANTGRLEGMPNLNLVAPYVQLARVIDPLDMSAAMTIDGARPSRADLEAESRSSSPELMRPLTEDRPQAGTVDQRWYWAAPILLDLAADPSATRHWWSKARPRLWTGDNADDDPTTASRGTSPPPRHS